MADRPHTPAERGFTLVELMVVVVIVAVLAAIGVYAVSRYVRSSKTAEAIDMIHSIKAAQEAYREETFSYDDVSQRNLEAYYPMSNPSSTKYLWDNPAADAVLRERWRRLGVSTTGYVLFGYSTVAGSATDPIPVPATEEPLNWPAPTGPWYLVQAVGDQTDDDVNSIFLASSFSSGIYSEHETE